MGFPIAPAALRLTNAATPGARAAILVIACALSSCTFVNEMMPGKREAQQRAEQLQSLQLNVMRFADEYVSRTVETMNRFQVTAVTPDERLAAQNWKVQQATAAYTVATGANPTGNAIDMVVLASLSRMVIDESWVGGTFGIRARPVQVTYQALESEAWELLTNVLTASQRTQLRDLITRWRAEHPEMHDPTYVHFRDFAEVGTPLSGQATQPGNLFAVLGIDPFSQLDPAVREIALARGLAERSMFYMQHVPALLDMQVERLSFQLAVTPEAKSVLGDLDRASLVGSASDQFVRTLPEILDRQRQALIEQLGGTLNEQSRTIDSMAGEVRTTLQAGTETADAIHRMLEAVERITTQFAAKPGGPTPERQQSPFDIRQYTEMLREATAAARELEALAQRANSDLPALRTATRDAATVMETVLDHAFLLLLLLVLAVVGATFLAMIAYRRMAPYFQRRNAVSDRAAPE